MSYEHRVLQLSIKLSELYSNFRDIQNEGEKMKVIDDEIILNFIPDFGPPVEKASIKGYIKHVSCEGARFHVLYWDDRGCHCSEEKCIINYRKQ